MSGGAVADGWNGNNPADRWVSPKTGQFTRSSNSRSLPSFLSRRSLLAGWVEVAGLIVLALAGCTMLAAPSEQKPPTSILAKPRMNPGSCAVEIFFVRFPLGAVVGNEELWRHVDESRLTPETRQILWANGFRAGVLGGCIPSCLAHLLGLHGPKELNPNTPEEELPPTGEVSVAKRHLQIPPRERREILVGSPREELTVFLAEKAGIRGRNYPEAQPVLALSWSPLPEGRLCLQIAPEITFGQPRTRYAAAEGHFRLDVVRPRETFPDMQITVNLAPGEMLILGGFPDRAGTLGHRFFIEDTQQRLVILRPVQTQHDELFRPEEFLRLLGLSG
jgi:hypothetical protein